LHTQLLTLFPYTTLFRSESQAALESARSIVYKISSRWKCYFDRLPRVSSLAGTPKPLSKMLGGRFTTENHANLDALSGPEVKSADRKSTRLNSSHEWSSY